MEYFGDGRFAEPREMVETHKNFAAHDPNPKTVRGHIQDFNVRSGCQWSLISFCLSSTPVIPIPKYCRTHDRTLSSSAFAPIRVLASIISNRQQRKNSWNKFRVIRVLISNAK